MLIWSWAHFVSHYGSEMVCSVVAWPQEEEAADLSVPPHLVYLHDCVYLECATSFPIVVAHISGEQLDVPTNLWYRIDFFLVVFIELFSFTSKLNHTSFSWDGTLTSILGTTALQRRSTCAYFCLRGGHDGWGFCCGPTGNILDLTLEGQRQCGPPDTSSLRRSSCGVRRRSGSLRGWRDRRRIGGSLE